MKTLKLTFFLLTIYLVSCNPLNDFNKGYIVEQDTEFGDKLILVREDTMFYRFVGAKNEKQIQQKGVIIQYHSSNGGIDTVKLWGGSSVINSHVNRINADKFFIIVDQKPLDSIFGKYDIRVKEDSSMRGRPLIPNNILETEKKLKESDIHCFWIINKKSDDIYGPMNIEDFVLKRKELNVSNKLEFNESDLIHIIIYICDI
jgi:hypothetical protein